MTKEGEGWGESSSMEEEGGGGVQRGSSRMEEGAERGWAEGLVGWKRKGEV